MGKSGNPAKRAEELKISQVGDFKKRIGGVFPLPSGLVVRLKNPGGMQAFLKNGLIPNSLMSIIQGSLESGQKMDEKALLNDKGSIDPEMLEDMNKTIDHAAVLAIVEPKVWEVPDSEDERDDDKLYVDELSEQDKMFVFQWITGGTSDLATFRERHEENVGALAAGQ